VYGVDVPLWKHRGKGSAKQPYLKGKARWFPGLGLPQKNHIPMEMTAASLKLLELSTRIVLEYTENKVLLSLCTKGQIHVSLYS